MKKFKLSKKSDSNLEKSHSTISTLSEKCIVKESTSNTSKSKISLKPAMKLYGKQIFCEKSKGRIICDSIEVLPKMKTDKITRCLKKPPTECRKNFQKEFCNPEDKCICMKLPKAYKGPKMAASSSSVTSTSSKKSAGLKTSLKLTDTIHKRLTTKYTSSSLEAPCRGSYFEDTTDNIFVGVCTPEQKHTLPPNYPFWRPQFTLTENPRLTQCIRNPKRSDRKVSMESKSNLQDLKRKKEIGEKIKLIDNVDTPSLSESESRKNLVCLEIDLENPMNLDFQGKDYAETYAKDEQIIEDDKEYIIEKRHVARQNLKKAIEEIYEQKTFLDKVFPKCFEITADDTDEEDEDVIDEKNPDNTTIKETASIIESSKSIKSIEELNKEDDDDDDDDDDNDTALEQTTATSASQEILEGNHLYRTSEKPLNKQILAMEYTSRYGNYYGLYAKKKDKDRKKIEEIAKAEQIAKDNLIFELGENEFNEFIAYLNDEVNELNAKFQSLPQLERKRYPHTLREVKKYKKDMKKQKRIIREKAKLQREFFLNRAIPKLYLDDIVNLKISDDDLAGQQQQQQSTLSEQTSDDEDDLTVGPKGRHKYYLRGFHNMLGSKPRGKLHTKDKTNIGHAVRGCQTRSEWFASLEPEKEHMPFFQFNPPMKLSQEIQLPNDPKFDLFAREESNKFQYGDGDGSHDGDNDTSASIIANTIDYDGDVENDDHKHQHKNKKKHHDDDDNDKCSNGPIKKFINIPIGHQYDKRIYKTIKTRKPHYVKVRKFNLRTYLFPHELYPNEVSSARSSIKEDIPRGPFGSIIDYLEKKDQARRQLKRHKRRQRMHYLGIPMQSRECKQFVNDKCDKYTELKDNDWVPAEEPLQQTNRPNLSTATLGPSRIFKYGSSTQPLQVHNMPAPHYREPTLKQHPRRIRADVYDVLSIDSKRDEFIVPRLVQPDPDNVIPYNLNLEDNDYVKLSGLRHHYDHYNPMQHKVIRVRYTHQMNEISTEKGSRHKLDKNEMIRKEENKRRRIFDKAMREGPCYGGEFADRSLPTLEHIKEEYKDFKRDDCQKHECLLKSSGRVSELEQNAAAKLQQQQTETAVPAVPAAPAVTSECSVCDIIKDRPVCKKNRLYEAYQRTEQLTTEQKCKQEKRNLNSKGKKPKPYLDEGSSSLSNNDYSRKRGGRDTSPTISTTTVTTATTTVDVVGFMQEYLKLINNITTNFKSQLNKLEDEADGDIINREEYLEELNEELKSIQSCVSSMEDSIYTNFTYDSGSFIIFDGKKIPLDYVRKSLVPFEEIDRCRVKGSIHKPKEKFTDPYTTLPFAGQRNQQQNLYKSNEVDNKFFTCPTRLRNDMRKRLEVEVYDRTKIPVYNDKITQLPKVGTDVDENCINDVEKGVNLKTFQFKTSSLLIKDALRKKFEICNMESKRFEYELARKKEEQYYACVYKIHGIFTKLFHKWQKKFYEKSIKKIHMVKQYYDKTSILRKERDEYKKSFNLLNMRIVFVEHEWIKRTILQNFHYLIMKSSWRAKHDWIHLKEDGTLENYYESIVKRPKINIRDRQLEGDNAWAIKKFYEEHFLKNYHPIIIVFPDADSFRCGIDKLRIKTFRKALEYHFSAQTLLNLEQNYQYYEAWNEEFLKARSDYINDKIEKSKFIDKRAQYLESHAMHLLDNTLGDTMRDMTSLKCKIYTDVVFNYVVSKDIRNTLKKDSSVLKKLEKVYSTLRHVLFRLQQYPFNRVMEMEKKLRKSLYIEQRKALTAYRVKKRIETTMTEIRRNIAPPFKKHKRSSRLPRICLVKTYKPKVIKKKILPKKMKYFVKAFFHNYRSHLSESISIDPTKFTSKLPQKQIPFYFDHFLRLNDYEPNYNFKTNVELTYGPEEKTFKYKDLLPQVYEKMQTWQMVKDKKMEEDIKNSIDMYTNLNNETK